MAKVMLQAQATRHPGKPRPKRGERWQTRFIRALSTNPSVEIACRAANITRQHAYRVRGKNAKFAAQWADAIESAVDLVEAQAYHLATHGAKRDVFMKLRSGKGKEEIRKVATNVEHFPQLQQFILKSRRPQIYGDKSNVDLTSGGAPIPAVSPATQVIIQLPDNHRGDPQPVVSAPPAPAALPPVAGMPAAAPELPPGGAGKGGAES